MADQIDRANVIRLERDESRAVWVARIGPREAGIEAVGSTPEGALVRLTAKTEAQDWWWDSAWKDTPE